MSVLPPKAAARTRTSKWSPAPVVSATWTSAPGSAASMRRRISSGLVIGAPDSAGTRSLWLTQAPRSARAGTGRPPPLPILGPRAPRRSRRPPHRTAGARGPCGGPGGVRVARAEVLQVQERHGAAAGELGQGAVPAVDRFVLDEERCERLLEEPVGLRLRLGLHQGRLRVALRLRHLRLGERLLALQLVLRLLRLLLGGHLLLQLLLDDVGQVARAQVDLVDHEAHLVHLVPQVVLDAGLELAALGGDQLGERHLSGRVLRYGDDRPADEGALDVGDVGTPKRAEDVGRLLVARVVGDGDVLADVLPLFRGQVDRIVALGGAL